MSNKLMTMAFPANKPQVKLPETETDPLYGAISPHRFVEFIECDRSGKPYLMTPSIKAMLTEGDETFESQWSTPFESSNPEHKLPTLMANLQAGQALEAAGRINDSNGMIAKGLSNIGKSIDALSPNGILKDALVSLVGRTNFTKVNSTQIFMSSNSVRINLTLFFIALRDARVEVEAKLMQLKVWTLPKKLYGDGIATAVIDKGWEGLFPSEIPPYMAVTISGRTYAPFIIESVSAPLAGPCDKDGNRLSLSVNVSIISRSAWDANDVINQFNTWDS